MKLGLQKYVNLRRFRIAEMLLSKAPGLSHLALGDQYQSPLIADPARPTTIAFFKNGGLKMGKMRGSIPLFPGYFYCVFPNPRYAISEPYHGNRDTLLEHDRHFIATLKAHPGFFETALSFIEILGQAATFLIVPIFFLGMVEKGDEVRLIPRYLHLHHRLYVADGPLKLRDDPLGEGGF